MSCKLLVLVVLFIFLFSLLAYYFPIEIDSSKFCLYNLIYSLYQLLLVAHSMMSEDKSGTLHFSAISRQHASVAGWSSVINSASRVTNQQEQSTTKGSHYSEQMQACTDKRCVNLLSTSSYKIYDSCEKSAFKKWHINEPDIPYNCVFRDGRGHDPVALISCPGSGNTWVRGLLEKATGICTGSVYCDGALRSGGFVGESIRDGSVIAIKTHMPGIHWRNKSQVQCNERGNACYGSAIFLIRNPFDSLVAERHRLKAKSHVSIVNKYQFGNSVMLETIYVIFFNIV